MKRRTHNIIPDQLQPRLMVAPPTVIHHGGGGKNATDARQMFNIQMQDDFTIGTWNVRTQYAHGKMEELIDEEK